MAARFGFTLAVVSLFGWVSCKTNSNWVDSSAWLAVRLSSKCKGMCRSNLFDLAERGGVLELGVGGEESSGSLSPKITVFFVFGMLETAVGLLYSCITALGAAVTGYRPARSNWLSVSSNRGKSMGVLSLFLSHLPLFQPKPISVFCFSQTC